MENINKLGVTPMATVDIDLTGEQEFFDDQIVPDQDDCFLPPSDIVPPPHFNVSNSLLFKKNIFKKGISLHF